VPIVDHTPSADRWMTVGEAARTLGMSRTTLLAAEEAGLLSPSRTPGGHRRYSAAELTRYLQRSGVAALAPTGAVPEPDPGPSTSPPNLVAALRTALRTVAQAVDADSAGLYLRDGTGTLRFTAAFGVPRWLVERLTADPAPAPVVDAAGTGRARLFDAAAAAFPEPRSTGHGLAVALLRGGGALFLVRPVGRELLPAELRVVDALRELLVAVVEAERRAAALEHRLARIAELSGGGGQSTR
jgi:excisionase family DNA binding protein